MVCQHCWNKLATTKWRDVRVCGPCKIWLMHLSQRPTVPLVHPERKEQSDNVQGTEGLHNER